MEKANASWFDGVISWGDYIFPEAISFEVNIDPKMITHNRGSGGDIEWPIGQKVDGSIKFTALNAALVAALTGGSLATGNIKRIRQGSESATITTNTITLAQADKVIEDTVRLYGANGTVFSRVSSAPAVGEFSYAPLTGVATFAAGETETTIYPDYLYTSSATGQTLTLGPSDVPAQISLYGSVRVKEIYSGALGDQIIYLKNVNRKGPLPLGGDSSGNTKEHSVDFSAIIAAEGDFKMYFPA